MMHYIIQIVAYQLLFIAVYDVFLKRETFFNYNRIYLLLTSVISLILPFVKIERFNNIISQDYIVKLPEIIIGQSQNTLSSSSAFFDALNFNSQSGIALLPILLYTGSVLALIIFSYKMIKMGKLISFNRKEKIEAMYLVSLKNSHSAFSFFKYIFLGDQISLKDRPNIIRHERVHIEERHSLDLLYFELLRIIFWFNPLVYMYQNRIATLHEFIADKKAVKSTDRQSYYENLLMQVFEVKKISFINPFFKESLIKKRIIMLSKTKSNQIKLIKYALVIPLVLAMLSYSSCVQETEVKEVKEATKVVSSKNVEVTRDDNGNITKVNVETLDKQSPLLKKILSLKKQIASQGYLDEKAEKGMSLLMKSVTGTEFDENLVNEMQAFIDSKNKNDAEKRIVDVFEQIQMQGNISDKEDKALKSLLVLTSKEGLDNVLYEQVKDEIEISFAVIENVPVYPGCDETLVNDDQKACFSKKINTHVLQNFNTEIGKELGLKGAQKINVFFKVDTKGYVTDIRIRAKYKELESEAMRVIQTLPKMKSGTQNGKNVGVTYYLPIKFNLD